MVDLSARKANFISHSLLAHIYMHNSVNRQHPVYGNIIFKATLHFYSP